MRYYACEAMYNIAKVGKGEILIYFNSIFDQLCKVRPYFRNGTCHVIDRSLTWLLSNLACCRLGAVRQERCRAP